jgi:hypothetical protein
MTLHDSEKVVGRIPVYDYQAELPSEPEEIEPVFATRGDVYEALAGFFIAVFLWMAIGQAAQVAP